MFKRSLLSFVVILWILSHSISGLASDWPTAVSNDVILEAHNNFFDAFAAPYSINKSEGAKVYIRSSSDFRLRVYRLGWYGDNSQADGGSKVFDQSDLAARNGGTKCGGESNDNAIRENYENYGLIECDWINPVVINNLQPGLYLARITTVRGDTTLDNIANFVVRDDTATSRLVVINPTTSQAYNNWSDRKVSDIVSGASVFEKRSLYGVNRVVNGVQTLEFPRASKVSFNRPSSTVPNIIKEAYPLIRFLEKEGIQYSLATDYDVHLNSSIANNRNSIVTVGHGEYWSYNARDSIEKFVNDGGNLVAMSANTGYWQVRYEQSLVGAGGPVIVSYKETATLLSGGTFFCGVDANNNPSSAVPVVSIVVNPSDYQNCSLNQGCIKYCYDPLYNQVGADKKYVTGLFRRNPVNKPEQSLLGVQYQISPAANGWGTMPVTFFEDSLLNTVLATGISNLGNLTSTSNPHSVYGHEGDVIHPFELFRAKPSSCTKVLGEMDWSLNVPSQPPVASEAGNYKSQIVLHRPSASSGHVVGGLSMLWSWGLDDWASKQNIGGTTPTLNDSRVSPVLTQMTKNMLNAAEANSFGENCSLVQDHSYFIGRKLDSDKTEFIVKENNYPGRWSQFEIDCGSGSCVIEENDQGDAKDATADLSGWAVNSEDYNLFVADVNADGKSDLVAKEKGTGTWAIAQSNGQKFTHHTTALTGWSVDSSLYNLFVEDVDGDGKADLIAQNKTDASWNTAMGNGGYFTNFLSSPAWGDNNLYNIFVDDVDGDNKADLIGHNKVDGSWATALSRPQGFVHHSISPTWADSNSYHLFTGDVDGDGKADLIAKQKSSGSWVTALGNGGTFTHHALALTGWADESVADYHLFVEDVNGDGKVDLIAKEKSDPGYWYIAIGNGNAFIPQGTPLLKTVD